MKLLVCNAGSTSLKFKLFEMPKERVLAEGKVERVGTDRAIYHFSKPSGFRIFRENLSIPTYTEGIQTFLNDLLDREHGELSDLAELERVGFKTVLSKGHYGIHELTPEVLQGMEDYMVVAPAHNRPYPLRLPRLRLRRAGAGSDVCVPYHRSEGGRTARGYLLLQPGCLRSRGCGGSKYGGEAGQTVRYQHADCH